MWLLKLMHLVLILASTGLLFGWTYYEAAVNHYMNAQKPFGYFFLIWGGTGLLMVIRSIGARRDIDGKIQWTLTWKIKPFTLGLIAFCCGITMHALAATTPEFDIDHLNMPYFLPFLFIPLHFLTAIWLLFKRSASQADRGLFLLLVFHTMDGAIFNAEFYVIAGLACITLLQALIENKGRWCFPPLLIGIPLSLLLLLSGFATWKSLNPVNAVPAFFHVGICAASFALIVSKPREERFFLRLFAVVLFAASIVFIAAIGKIWAVSLILGLQPVLATRLDLFYQHPNFLAPYFSMISFLALGLVCVRIRPLFRVLAAGLCFFALTALRLTDSRAGFLGFIVGAGVLILFLLPLHRFPWHRLNTIPLKVKLGGVIVLAGAGMGLTALGIWHGDDLISAARNSTRLQRALDYRWDAWTNSMEIIRSNKLHGVGLNTFISAKKFPPGSKFAHESDAPHPHNLLLYVAQSTGIPALVVFLILLGGFFLYAIRLRMQTTSPTIRGIIIGCLAAAAALLTCGAMDLGLSLVTLFPGPLWWFMGIISSMEANRTHRLKNFRIAGIGSVFITGLLLIAFTEAFLRPDLGRLLLRRTVLTQFQEGPKACYPLGEMALAADPLLEQAREFLLKTYQQENRREKAFHLLEDSIRLQPNLAINHMKLGNLLLEDDKVEEAAIQFKQAVELDHGSIDLPNYHARLINCEALRSDSDTVKALLVEAIRRNIAVINLVKWAKSERPDGHDDQYLEIHQSREILHLEDALDEIFADLRLKAEEGLPQDRYDWFSLFQAYHNAFDYDRALEVLDGMEEVFGDTERAMAYGFRAVIAKEQGDLELSKTYIAQAATAGDKANPAATLQYKSRTVEFETAEDPQALDSKIADHKKALDGLRDYLSSIIAYNTILDNLIQCYKAKEDREPIINLLNQRLFFVADRQERPAFLLCLAECYREIGRFEDAERALLDLIDNLAARQRRLSELDYLPRREPVVATGCAMADLYHAMGLTPAQALARIKTRTDWHSSNPCRLLFNAHFLVRSGIPDQAERTLRLAIMDEKRLLFLQELLVDCRQMLDDLPGLRQTYIDIEQIYQSKGIDLEARANALIGEVLKDLSRVELILELVRAKGYTGKYDHSLAILNEAINKYHPEEARLYRLAALIYRLDNKPVQARDTLIKAISYDPDDLKARIALENLEAHGIGAEPANNRNGEGP
ncbi:MAG: O-antigen ligase family protein [Planctomycetes bacterium]|nr:O-antigen ligase family protein [Planctomycetota bacterium]